MKMEGASHRSETSDYSLALIDSCSRMIMGTGTLTGRHCLPRITIPNSSRHAEEINAEIKNRWGFKTIVLSYLSAMVDRPTCAVAEVISSTNGIASSGLVSRSPNTIGELTAEERAVLNNTIEGSLPSRGPFARLGWFREALDWFERSVTEQDVHFSGEFCQYYAHSTFALVRLGATNRRAYWLKASGEPNAHECGLTVELSRLFPQYLPRLIAVREDWNAWLTEDAGASLCNCNDCEMLKSAVETLAELQIRSASQVAAIRAAGCIERGLIRVQYHLGEMFSFLEEAMQLQTSSKVKPLTATRLREILAVIDEACDKMQNLGIPACLINADINPYNILFDGKAFRFIDWAEAGVGNPFLTLQQVIQHVIYEGEHLEWIPYLRDAYKKKWLAALEERQIDCAFRLMPLLTIVDHLYFRGDWLHSSRRNDPSFQSGARALARYMDRAVIEMSSAEGV